ncbi:MAG: lycopene cyclase domain-containing protein, partial [Sediminibacterium sp.]|nr:lycopene cyclase domain-containing protein [Sediminibacterium sp.]
HLKYTFYSLVSTGFLMLFLIFIMKVRWLPKILSIYPVLLIPFFIVNGILTGSGLESPIVWYNNAENLAIRLRTIPVEDIFYGLELILLNIYFFEILKK